MNTQSSFTLFPSITKPLATSISQQSQDNDHSDSSDSSIEIIEASGKL
jgi:hypothetical protein